MPSVCKKQELRVATAYRLKPTVFSTRAAFSLLEVLLATTVLIMIIMVISLVFRQTHTAWVAGTRQADADTELRSILGFIERDLTHAVDGTARFGPDFGISFTDPSGAGTGHYHGLSFVTIDGTNRVPMWVTYKYDTVNTAVYRATQMITVQAGAWSPLDPPTIITDASNPAATPPLNSSKLSECDFFPVYANGAATTSLPLRVNVKVVAVPGNSFAFVSGRSQGPDGQTGTADDIVVGE